MSTSYATVAVERCIARFEPRSFLHYAKQGADGEEAKTGTPSWHWGRLLGRVLDLDMATCPFCRRGALRIIAAITQESVITRILCHLKLASVPPPIAPARCRQEICAFDSAHASAVP